MLQNSLFMDNKDKKHLIDILTSMEEIESFVEERGRRYDVFCSDRCFYRAVQMNIAIIGEATNRLLKTRPDISITGARKIVDTRNYVIHGYDSLLPEILWGIVIKDLPRLKAEVIAILNS